MMEGLTLLHYRIKLTNLIAKLPSTIATITFDGESVSMWVNGKTTYQHSTEELEQILLDNGITITK